MAHTQRQNDRFYQRRETPPAPKKPLVKTTGQKELWLTLQTVTIEGGPTKTTRAMRVQGGVIVNTCTRGANFAAEALVFVPGATVIRDGQTFLLVAQATP